MQQQLQSSFQEEDNPEQLQRYEFKKVPSNHKYYNFIGRVLWTKPGKKKSTISTGTLIKPNIVITCAHGLQMNESKESKVQFQLNKKIYNATAYVFPAYKSHTFNEKGVISYEDKDNDFAFLKLHEQIKLQKQQFIEVCDNIKGKQDYSKDIKLYTYLDQTPILKRGRHRFQYQDETAQNKKLIYELLLSSGTSGCPIIAPVDGIKKIIGINLAKGDESQIELLGFGILIRKQFMEWIQYRLMKQWDIQQFIKGSRLWFENINSAYEYFTLDMIFSDKNNELKKQIKEIIFDNIRITSQSIRLLSIILQKNKIKKLSIRNCNMKNRLQQFFKEINKIQLSNVQISHIEYSKSNWMVNLFQIRSNYEQYQLCDLSNNKSQNFFDKIIRQPGMRFPKLKYLSLNGNQLGDHGIRSLQNISLQNLEFLNISQNNITSNCLIFLQNFNCIRLKQLGLHQNLKISSSALKNSISKLIKAFRQLNLLSFHATLNEFQGDNLRLISPKARVYEIFKNITIWEKFRTKFTQIQDYELVLSTSPTINHQQLYSQLSYLPHYKKISNLDNLPYSCIGLIISVAIQRKNDVDVKYVYYNTGIMVHKNIVFTCASSLYNRSLIKRQFDSVWFIPKINKMNKYLLYKWKKNIKCYPKEYKQSSSHSSSYNYAFLCIQLQYNYYNMPQQEIFPQLKSFQSINISETHAKICGYPKKGFKYDNGTSQKFQYQIEKRIQRQYNKIVYLKSSNNDQIHYGMCGAPIIQDNKIIGIHITTTSQYEFGYGLAFNKQMQSLYNTVKNNLRQKQNFSELILWQQKISLGQIYFFKNHNWYYLIRLDLGWNYIDDQSFRHITKAFFQNLQLLSLKNNLITYKGIFHFTRQKNIPKLKKLYLGSNFLENEGFIHFINYNKSDKLSYLDISYNKITYEGLKTFAEIKKWENNLQILQLNGNKFTGTQIKQFYENRKNTNNTLKRISFSKCCIKQEFNLQTISPEIKQQLKKQSKIILQI